MPSSFKNHALGIFFYFLLPTNIITQSKACSPSIPNCKNCDDSNICLECNSWFILRNNQCVCPKESCLSYNTNCECITCEPGYSINDNKNCVLNNCTSLEYCTKCNGAVCLECIGAYQVKSDRCQKPSGAIIGVIVVFMFIVIAVWIVIFVLIRPKIFS